MANAGTLSALWGTDVNGTAKLTRAIRINIIGGALFLGLAASGRTGTILRGSRDASRQGR